MAKSPLATLKYLSTLLVCALALGAAWWLWNYYMQGPWTRDGKVRAELVSVTPEVSGKLLDIRVQDNQLVKRGDLLFRIDPEPYRIAERNAVAALGKAESDFAKASHEASRRRNLARNVISAEAVDEAELTQQAMQAAFEVAKANLAQAQWSLAKTDIHASTDGYITNLQTRVGNYASAGIPLVALIDTHSFYVLGYFEETKLRHIRIGRRAKIVLYSSDRPLTGTVESIGRAIHDQSLESGSGLLVDVKPNVPWVRLAQRVPVRIRLDKVPADVTLIAGTTASIAIHD
jgi:RND family efflux transporter MFP subunit